MRTFLGLVLVLAAACAKEHSRGPDASMSGAGGSAGTGGGGGAGGSGGSSGVGGAYEPECTSDADCVLVNDCCTCEAIPKDQPPPPACERLCIIDSCSSIGAAGVACRAGHCVLDVSCDQSGVTCPALPPQCPAGQTVTVRDGCFGGCVDVHECHDVATCDACGDNDVCVDGLHCGRGLHCVEAPPECDGVFGCECMSRACASPAFCWDNEPGDRRLDCGCEF